MSSQNVNKISSLKELRLEKDRLARESEIAKKAIGKSLQNSQKVTSSFLLKTVIAPAGAAGVAFLLASKLMKPGEAKEEATRAGETLVNKQSQPSHPQTTDTPSTPDADHHHQLAPEPTPDSSKRGINWSALIDAGKFLIPLVRMIIGVVNQEIAKREQKSQKAS